MNMRARLLEAYWPLERMIMPGLKSSQTAYEQVLQEHIDATTRWLDLGCGRRVLPPWRRSAEEELVRRSAAVVGLDHDLESLRDNATIARLCRGRIRQLPFADESFDLVTANMVMEHLEHPADELREMHRVLRPGGTVILHTVNTLGHPTLLARLLPYELKRELAFFLDGRDARDVFPTFYRANSSRSIRCLAQDAKLHVTELRVISSSAVLAIIPPLALVELLWLRALRSDRLAFLRSNLIVTLTRSR